MNGIINATMKKFSVTGKNRVEFVDADKPDSPLGANEVEGEAICSLVSPGTELAMLAKDGATYPRGTGYATIFEIDAVGSEVEGLKKGDNVFCTGNHCSHHRLGADGVVKVPEGLAPETAVFCRMMGISMTTLDTTKARPPYTVVVTGLGMVGNLAAQMFQAAGYRTIACDPVRERRELAEKCGLKDVRPSVPIGDPDVEDKAYLVVECSGHEQAVLDGCNIVRRGGEVVLIGVPWVKRTGLSAHDILHAVFHKYVHLRTGWEWELPWNDQDFAPGSIMGNFEGALRWLSEGRVDVSRLYGTRAPEDVAEVYGDLLEKKNEGLTTLIKWR